jgi:ADP-ribosylglycohydrolase
VCHVAGESWLCLHCGNVFCSRYVNGHALKHHQETSHSVACSFADLSFWCYSCDSYITHSTLWPLFSSLHEIKFGIAPGAESVRVSSHQLAEVAERITAPIIETEEKEKEISSTPTSTSSSTSSTSTSTSTSSSSSSSSSSGGGDDDEDDEWWVAGLDKKWLQDPLINKVLGCIYGNALGDAVGLATEFQTKDQIKMLYGNDPIPFPGYRLNLHNRRWTRGDWTDDTDQMILIMETILETGGKVSPQLFARKLKQWIHNGFPELGDFGGMGLGFTVSKVVQHSSFLLDPHGASKAVWKELNKDAAANGAVMRTSIFGILDYKDIEKVIENTLCIAKVTHHDPRCLASCVATTTAIALMLQGFDVSTEEGLQKLIDQSIQYGAKFSKDHDEQFRAHIKRDDSVESLTSLELDDQKKIGYTLKCVGAGFWGLCGRRSFKETIDLLIKEGGDADTNGAVCGALYGTRWGYSSLPRDWLQAMPHKAWLDAKVVAFLRLLQLIPENDVEGTTTSTPTAHTQTTDQK